MGSIYRRRYRTADGTVKESPTWWLKFYKDGRAIRESAETEKETEARRLLKIKEGDAAKGLPVVPRANRVRVSELLADVRVDYQINKRRSLADLECRIRLHLDPFFGARRAAGVTSANISQYVKERQEAGAANGAINRELTVLKRAFNLGLRSNKVLTKPYIALLREADPRSGFLDKAAVDKIRANLPSHLSGVIGFAFQTGWRTASEILPLRWSHVDFRSEVVRIDPGASKDGAGRLFPFTDELREILKAQREYTDRVQRERGVVVPTVFHHEGRRIGSFRKAWARACYKAGLPCSVETEIGRDGKPRIKSIKAETLVHDLRRSAVRSFVRSGMSETIAMKLSGHRTANVFRRYNVSSESDLRIAAAMLSNFHATGTNSGTTTGKANSPQPQLIDSTVSGR